MLGKKSYLIAGAAMVVLLVPSLTSVSYAAYFGNIDDSTAAVGTLEANLKIAREKVLLAEKFPGAGSGTPYFEVDGVMGASLIAGSIFGGITAAFVMKARNGRYVSPGMG